MAAPGVRGQDAREKWKKVQPGEARFGPELDGEKLWRRQVFRARKDARKERKRFILIRIQRGRLGAKVRPGEARFGPELDGEKLWRRQVFGARMREKNGRKLSLFSSIIRIQKRTESATRGGSFWTRIRLGKAVA